MVTDIERDYLWETYAADRRARLNLGIRRRLSPLLERDRRRIELMNCLLLSMPGTPVIYYGDEIGMGDNIHLGDRDGVRTPMQWSPDRNGGFSRADPAALGAAADHGPALRLRGGQCRGAEPRSAFAAELDAPHAGRTPPASGVRPRPLAVALSEEPQGPGLSARIRGRDHSVRRQLSRTAAGGGTRSVGVRGPHSDRAERRLAVSADRPAHLSADAAALRILLVHPRQGGRLAVLAHAGTGTHARISDDRSAQRPRRRPCSSRTRTCSSARCCRPISPSGAGSPPRTRRWRRHALPILRDCPARERELLLGEIETDNEVRHGALAAAACDRLGRRAGSALPSQLALARVRRGARVGLLTDAFAVPAFAHRIVAAACAGLRPGIADGEIRFEPTPDWRESLHLPADAEINWLSAEQSNSSLIVGDAVMLKIFRRIAGGPHPEAEMGRYLTEQGFANTPPLLGEIVRVGTGWHASHARDRAGFRSQPGRRLDVAARSAARAPSTISPRRPRVARRGSRSHVRLRGAGGKRSDTGSARCTSCWRGRPTIRLRSRARRPPQDVARWASARSAQLEAAFDVIAERNKWDRPDDEARAAALQKSRAGDYSPPCTHLAQAGAGSLDEPHPRRFPSRPGAGRQRRRLHHRFRGRAGAPARGAPGQDQPAPRRRRHAALVRLCGATIMERKNVGVGADIAEERRDEFLARFRARAPTASCRPIAAATGASGAAASETAARSVPDREGRLRDHLRGRQPADLA